MEQKRPPCYGCKYCTRIQDENYIFYSCTKTIKGGRRLLKITANPLNRSIESAVKYIDNQIRTRMSPIWCPKRKETK